MRPAVAVLLLAAFAAFFCLVEGGGGCNPHSPDYDCPEKQVCLKDENGNGHCGSCTAHTHCRFGDKCLDGQCRSALFPLTWHDIAATACCFVGCMVAVAGGIGGGGLFVPLFMLILKFEAERAVPLSKAMIFGAAIISNFFNFRKKLPLRQLVNVSLVLEPLCLSGTILGVILNLILPNWLIVSLLCVTLFAIAGRTFMNGRRVYLIEREMERTSVRAARQSMSAQLDLPLERDDTQLDPLIDEGSDSRFETSESSISSTYSLGVDTPNNLVTISKRSKPRFERILKAFARMKLVLLLLLVWVVLLTCAFGKKAVEGCSLWYWGLDLLPVIVSLVVTAVVGIHLKRQHDAAIAEGVKFSESDFVWSSRNTFVFPFVSFVAGMLAGMLGIGGGMVIGPMLLEMSRKPDAVVTSAISSFMVLFTSSATTIQFIALGSLRYDYALWFAGFSIVAATLGSTLVSWLIRKFNRKSYIVFALAIVLLVSAVLSVFELYHNLSSLVRHSSGSVFSFSTDDLCHPRA